MTTYTPAQDAKDAAEPAAKTKTRTKISLKREARPYINPYLGGILLGLVLFSAFFITGSGLGASGGMNRLLVVIEDALVPGHVDRTPYLLAMAGGDKNPLDSWVVWVTVGTIFGGLFSGWRNGRIKVETNRGPRMPVKLRWVTAFIGGAFMGYGARFARGCTSGQALSGGAVLSVGSWAFMFAVFAGAYALAYFVRKLWI